MPLVERDDSFLAVIDVQRDFYRGRDDVDPNVFARFVARVAWTVAMANALGVPIVVTEESPDYNGSTVDAVQSRLAVGTPTLTKPIFGLSYVEDIRSVVESFGRKTAVLVGMETDVCVAHSALGLSELGYRVVAVPDALFSPGEAQDHGIHRLRQAGIELVSAKALFYEWVRTVEAAVSFVLEHPELGEPEDFSL